MLFAIYYFFVTLFLTRQIIRNADTSYSEYAEKDCCDFRVFAPQWWFEYLFTISLKEDKWSQSIVLFGGTITYFVFSLMVVLVAWFAFNHDSSSGVGYGTILGWYMVFELGVMCVWLVCGSVRLVYRGVMESRAFYASVHREAVESDVNPMELATDYITTRQYPQPPSDVKDRVPAKTPSPSEFVTLEVEAASETILNKIQPIDAQATASKSKSPEDKPKKASDSKRNR
jgi:hypothetical protein